MPLVEWQRPSEEALALRALARRISATNKIKAQVKNQLGALMVTQETPEVILTQTKSLIGALEEQIASFRINALNIVDRNKELREGYVVINC